MKFGKLLLGSLASLALLTGCNKEEEKPEVAPSMTLDQETLTFSNVLGEQRIQITSNVDWTVSDIPSWITVKPTSGTASEKPVYVSIEVGTNEERVERSATLKFTSEKISKTLKVTQKAADVTFSVSEVGFAAKPEAGSIKFEVRSNVAWTVKSDNKDFRVTPESGNGTAEVTVSYTMNNNGAPRVATITVATTEDVSPKSYDVKITQEGVQPQLSVSESEITAAVEGGEVKFNITGNVDWKITCSNDAFKVNPLEGHGDKEITVTYPANETPNPVSATLTVVAQNLSVDIRYDVKINQPAGGGAKVDVLTAKVLGATSACQPFSDVKGEGFAASYSGRLLAYANTLAFKKKQTMDKLGVYSSTSGGKVKKINVKWSPAAISGTLLIYCSNEPYTSIDDFYSTAYDPKKEIGKMKVGEEVFEIPGDYKYVGIRTDDTSEVFVDSIEITWE